MNRYRYASQFRHEAESLPLGFPSDVPVKPEAVLALAHERECFVKFLARDEVSTVSEQQTLLKAKRVDGAQPAGGQDRAPKPQLPLHPVRESGIRIRSAGAKTPCQLSQRGLLFLRLRARDSIETGGRRTAQIATEFAGEYVPNGHGA